MTEPTFGQQFRQARIKADLDLKEVAEMLGRSITTVGRIENDNAHLNARTRERAKAVLEQMRNRAQR